MGGAEYNPYESDEDDDPNAPRELDKPIASQSVKLRKLRDIATLLCFLWSTILLTVMIDPEVFVDVILRQPPPADRVCPQDRGKILVKRDGPQDGLPVFPVSNKNARYINGNHPGGVTI